MSRLKSKWMSAIGALVIGISISTGGGNALATDEPVRDVANLFPYRDAELTLINHRGLSPNMPENTLVAFRNSVAMGVDVIEIDLRPTKDGKIVILHDDTVDRTTDGTGAVKDLTLEEVKQLDAGSYAGEEFAGEQIPTYAEALETVKGTGVRLLLDIKDASQVQQIVEVTEQYDMIDQVIVGPRSVAALQEFKALNPDLTTLGFIGNMADADASSTLALTTSASGRTGFSPPVTTQNARPTTPSAWPPMSAASVAIPAQRLASWKRWYPAACRCGPPRTPWATRAWTSSCSLAPRDFFPMCRR